MLAHRGDAFDATGTPHNTANGRDRPVHGKELRQVQVGGADGGRHQGLLHAETGNGNATANPQLELLAQGEEFAEVRFHAGEKTALNNIIKSPAIRFPVSTDRPPKAKTIPQKVSLVVQCALANITYSTLKINPSHLLETSLILKDSARLCKGTPIFRLTASDARHQQVLRGRHVPLQRPAAAPGHRHAHVGDQPAIADAAHQHRYRPPQPLTPGIQYARSLRDMGIDSLEKLAAADPRRIELVNHQARAHLRNLTAIRRSELRYRHSPRSPSDHQGRQRRPQIRPEPV